MPQHRFGEVKGGLLLDSHEAMLKGGDTGPSLVPGNPDKSLLITAVTYSDKDLQMPPKGEKLADKEIADLKEWVKVLVLTLALRNSPV